MNQIDNYDHIIVNSLSFAQLIKLYGKEYGTLLDKQGNYWCVFNSATKQVISEVVSSPKVANDIRECLIDQWENDCDTSKY